MAFGAFNRLAAGKKVYGNGSHAPTKGTVDPSGYIKRELKKRTQSYGRPDTLSQNRSGLAAQALRQRANDVQSQYNSAKNIKPVSTFNAPNKVNQKTFDQSNDRSAGGSNNGNTPAFASLSTAGTPSMQITDTGQLELPYDNAFAWDLLQAKGDLNSQLLSLNQQAQQQALEYARTKRDAQIDYADAQRGTLNNAAARGMAFSSLYGSNVADNARNYNNYMTDLEQANSLFNQGVTLSRTQIENALNEYLRMAALQQGMNTEDQAGDLGYGTDPVDPSYPGPSAGNGGGSTGNKGRGNSVNMDNFPRIQRLLDRYNGDKSKIVAAMVGKGNAEDLGDNQLRAIGFGNQFINNHDEPDKKRGPGKIQKDLRPAPKNSKNNNHKKRNKR